LLHYYYTICLGHNLTTWSVIVSYFGIGYRWLPPQLHYLHHRPYVLQRVSTAVWGAFVKVTNLMAAQDIPQIITRIQRTESHKLIIRIFFATVNCMPITGYRKFSNQSSYITEVILLFEVYTKILHNCSKSYNASFAVNSTFYGFSFI
jgi:hypothetical protein